MLWNRSRSKHYFRQTNFKSLDAIFVGILLRDFARDFGIEFESSRHREIFEISSRAVKKL